VASTSFWAARATPCDSQTCLSTVSLEPTQYPFLADVACGG